MDIEKYVGPIYGYCIKRLQNTFDAQDLAQEILFEIFRALPNTDVRNIEAWVWRIAHNRYARFLNSRSPNLLSLDDAFAGRAAEPQSDEAADAAFAALHAIASEHREVLVDHYVYGLSCEEIACKRGLGCSTVRTRLHYGRDKLRKRWNENMETSRIYDKLHWHIFGNGDVNVEYLRRQITRAILHTCQRRYMTIEEIAEATGMPCMYIEDELAEMAERELVYRKGSRYIAGVILYTGDYLKKVNVILKDRSTEILQALLRTIKDNDAKIRSIGFYGCDADMERMGWWLVPVLMRAACNKARCLIGFERDGFYPRLDGGNGWLVAYEKSDEVRRYYAGCNNYYLDNSRFRYFWTDKYLDTGLVALLRRLEDSEALCDDPVLAAECVRCGLAVSDQGSIRLRIPVFSKSQFEQLNELATQCVDALAEQLTPVAERLLLLMRSTAPKHLHEQLRGLFGIDFNAIIAVICDMLEQQRMLESPCEQVFAGQVIMIE